MVTRAFLFLVIFLFQFGKLYALENVSPVVDTNFISDGESFDVIFQNIGTRSCNIKVRPVAEHGLIEIFDRNTLDWIKGSEVWSNLPPLCERISLRIFGMPKYKNQISFYLQDSYSGQLTATKITMWNRKLNDDYIRRLNLTVYNADQDLVTLHNRVRKFPVLLEKNGKIHR
ncbi:hypothetical protein A2619_02720 [candidate division WWE3 bacterium RIFOXYD1_FULL_39_9]|uniref:Uncharacterized protein n=1 Tax=candidate division WWE3 bacterium RIFOXYD1_FULL_39_9 TaxID=1802649 RepID=A0A1F4XAY9_UNCKA|nr:MAG: hypothetical protein A2619_02720 [candidate division WWE3 bacterium RIFOXYD1_FULL_39_9]